MENIDKTLQRAKHEISRSKNDSPTEAGQTDRKQATSEHIDAINQIFGLLSVNYHNQYYAAFNNQSVENQAKRLWLHSVGRYEIETLLLATRQIIETSEYLPTLHQFLGHCDQLEHQLPSEYDAYVEACGAADQLASHQWTHAAVYHAGKATGWHFLRSQTEKQVFPIFKEQYDKQKSLIRDGHVLPAPDIKALEKTTPTPLSAEQQKSRLAKLKAELDL